MVSYDTVHKIIITTKPNNILVLLTLNQTIILATMSDDNKTPIATSTTTNATTTDVDDTTDVPNLESEDKNKQQQRSKNNNNNNNNNNNISSPTTTTTTTHQQLLEDNSDHSAVMVDHKDAEEHRGALQIVRIGSEENGMSLTRPLIFVVVVVVGIGERKFVVSRLFFILQRKNTVTALTTLVHLPLITKSSQPPLQRTPSSTKRTS